MKNLINSKRGFHLQVITISFLFLVSSFKIYSQEDKNKENENADYRKDIDCLKKDWDDNYFPIGIDLLSRDSSINPKARHKLFQFNLFYGESLNVYGLQAGLVNTNCREFKEQPTYQVGLSLAGLVNQNDSLIGVNAGFLANISNKVYGASVAGINNSAKYQNGISFASWENRSYALNGIQLAIFENIIYTQNGIVMSVLNNTTGQSSENDRMSNGILFAGIKNDIKNKSFSGVAIGGIGSEIRGEFKGVSIGGIGSHISGDTYGLSAGLLSSNVKKSLYGVSISAISSNVDEKMHGVSFGGLVSRCSEMYGLSGSLFINAGENHGVQIAPINIGWGNHFFQLGVINATTKENNSFQLGLINYSHEDSKLQIGLINIARNNLIPILPFVNF